MTTSHQTETGLSDGFAVVIVGAKKLHRVETSKEEVRAVVVAYKKKRGTRS
jgi:hypothetical protein